MRIENDKTDYRRASIDDIDSLVGFRVRFLGELYDHPEDDETEVLRRALQGYLSEAIPANDFIAWLAEYDGKVIGVGGMIV
ncbi:MAG: hypothetical protein Q6361_08120, partial [Candidatus Hermodarchaeota archaeon]|nr:hypothetical protein [Candidatus Hermodarchaeota archaeon]